MTFVVQIRCDAETRSAECMDQGEPPGSPQTAYLARAGLQDAGWHRVKSGRDICPACWAKGER